MPNETIYKNDMQNRFPTYSLTKTVTGAITKYELKDGGTVIASAKAGDAGAAIFKLREQMGLGIEIPPLLTETQRNALTGVTKGQPLLVDRGSGVHVQQFHDGTGWKTITHT